MNETTIAVLTVVLGELFLCILVLAGTLFIYFRFAQPDDVAIDMDSIEMSDLNEKVLSTMSLAPAREEPSHR
jgi:hypothetical protein